ncbi:26S proteasome non-ATPase regulatory subunit 3 homolog A-like [Lolium rigidum]|uniref:26S proteasome non-ATPase regulatory subunit 3 homolog A-like n=1 Tax=Lolium rigidum TaxID=89674 RepID=UPI001F5E1A31|nr:26S proteasome non-ATPase regulatory subunit 3 homolog A-like [Lolium rigidum]
MSIARLKNLNRRTVDVLASRLYSYYSYAHELTNSLAEIRGMATLHRDELGQETLLNLLLRNYLHYNLSDQAEKLRLKAPRFEAHSNQQFCRYLVYLGKIRTIRLEYTDVKGSLLQAARKAPTAARGFRIQCNKWVCTSKMNLTDEIGFQQIKKGIQVAVHNVENMGFELTAQEEVSRRCWGSSVMEEPGPSGCLPELLLESHPTAGEDSSSPAVGALQLGRGDLLSSR